MRRFASKLALFVVSAAVSFASVLLVAWPVDTWADDAPAASVGADATKMGALIVTSRLVEDARAKGTWYVEAAVTNTSHERDETADFETCLEQQVSNPMARVPSMPTVVWRERQSVTVPPGQTVMVRRPVPALLAAKIARAQARPTRADSVPSAVTSFRATVQRSAGRRG